MSLGSKTAKFILSDVACRWDLTGVGECRFRVSFDLYLHMQGISQTVANLSFDRLEVGNRVRISGV